MDVKRYINVTNGLLDENLRASIFVCDAIEVIGSMWDMKSEEELRLHVGPDVPAQVRGPRQREAIIFMSSAEVDGADADFAKPRLTLHDVMQNQFVCSLDPGCCLTGACGAF